MSLSKEDIEFLIDCVSAKEASAPQGDMISDMLEAIFMSKSNANKQVNYPSHKGRGFQPNRNASKY